MTLALGIIVLALVELAVAGGLLASARRMSSWPVQRVPVRSPLLSDPTEGDSWVATARLPDGRDVTVNVSGPEATDATIHLDPRSERLAEPGVVAGRRRLGLIMLPGGAAMLVAGAVLLVVLG